MSEADEGVRRVRFYGVHDLAAGLHAPRVAELATRFDRNSPLRNVMDALEFHNVEQYLEHELLPGYCTKDDRDALVAKAPQIRSSVARFFTAIDNSNFVAIAAAVGREYHGDFLNLLGRNKAFERCKSAIVLPALRATGVHLGDMLASRWLVRSYDLEMRGWLLASAQGAEFIIRKYLEKDARGEIYLPLCLTPMDSRGLLQRYVDDDDSNLNYVRLISTSNDHSDAGIDAKLRLRAKRRTEELTAKLFEQAKGFGIGCEVSISNDQEEPVVSEVDSSDGSILRYVYGRRWLEETTDYSNILNNFLHLFEFADHQVILILPAYPSHFSVIERATGLTGNAEYKVGAVFWAMDARSLSETLMYRRFLQSRDIDLEQVISWFFETYLVENFGVRNFSFAPSAFDASYLQRVRHLFAEMESVSSQFELFVQNGELDRDLLTMGSNQVLYKEIPSLLEGKYLYASQGEEIATILHLLFSDQSTLCYIDDGLRANSAFELLLRNVVEYDDFRDHQKISVNHLIDVGILEDIGARVRPANMDQLSILAALFHTQAANYYHLSTGGRAEADDMVERGWVTRLSSLLSGAEGDYFNYFLNKVGFSNGPNLRNRYLHGSQAGHDSDRVHFDTYLVALRLTVALVIKINDDLQLAEAEDSVSGDDGRRHLGPERSADSPTARARWEFWQ